MRIAIVGVAVAASTVMFASNANACSPVVEQDRITGATLTSGTPEWQRREQARWRAEAGSVFVAQVRAARMVRGGELEFTLTPIATVYGGSIPDADLMFRWQPGNTCNPFPIAISDYLVIYASDDEPDWSIIGMTTPDRLQDRPADFPSRMRNIHRGVIPGPPLVD